MTFATFNNNLLFATIASDARKSAESSLI